jgi:uncharacterized membrane protein (DUF441 family)
MIGIDVVRLAGSNSRGAELELGVLLSLISGTGFIGGWLLELVGWSNVVELAVGVGVAALAGAGVAMVIGTTVVVAAGGSVTEVGAEETVPEVM